ncbi:acyltransferase, partial [Leuconostoc mesenteroides]|nr:acyltransferase [Leuconostoc mesenteroides]
SGMGGGFIGDDAFLALTGYLITPLLLDQLRRNALLDLRGLLLRRARRLLPALVLMGLPLRAARALSPDQALTGLRSDAIAAFLWTANWRFVAQNTDYFTQGAPPSPLQHTWSLGVEEQYYVVWPLLLIGATLLLAARARRRCRRATVGGVRFAAFLIASLGT